MMQDTCPYWGRVWQITSGNLKNVSREEVHLTLTDRKDDIIRGILLFKKTDGDKDAELSDKRAKDITYFISRTAEYLNVNTVQAWNILKSYIINEYCGSIKTIKKMKYEMQILPMLNNCWRFFTSERMFLIKTIKNIIEYMENKDHPYNDIYKAFVESVDCETIWKALVREMEYLINELQGEVVEKMSEIVQKNWVQRNMRELIEITHCLIMITRHTDIQISHFHSILTLCKKHGFGNEPLYFGALALAEPYLLNKLRYSEIAILLCIANQLWIKKETRWYLSDTNLKEEFAPLAYRQEHGAVSYIWITFQLSLRNNSKFDENYFYKYILQAITLECFQFFCDMLANEMFEDASLVSTYVQISLYNMFAISFENIDLCNKYFRFSQISEVMKLLLKNNFICERYFSEIKFTPLWLTAVERYPLEKDILSKLAEAIITSEAGVADDIIAQLENLPWYTEIYDPSKVHHTQRHNNSDMYTAKLLSQRTISNSVYSLIIPPNSEAIIKKEFGVTHIHYKKQINYWLVLLAEVNTMLGDTGNSHHYESVNLGLKVMLAVLKLRPNSIKENPMFTEIIILLFAVLEKYSISTEKKPLDMLATCIDICSELLLKCRPFVCSQMDTFHLLPTLAKIDFTYEEIFQINFLEPGKLGNLIVRSEREQHHDLLLISYLNFLRTSLITSDGCFQIIELPGLVFVLKEIFPHFMLWFAKRDRSYIDVLYQIIHFLFEMFQFSSVLLDIKEYANMQKIAFQSFLNETCGRSLLRILLVGNTGVQNLMEGQTNWHAGRGIKYISVIQKVMSILIQLLTQKKTVIGDNGLTPLEHMIYTESDGVHSLQAIASFLNHSFNEAIPNLACRLLKKYTVELQMSMLAALDLAPDQVRMMFVQRLRDHLVCDEMKLAIIELISASVPKQPGMTEAFFKVSSLTGSSVPSSQTSVNTTMSVESLNSFNEGIGTFLVEYLYAFSSETSTISSPLLSRIMELLHILWMHQKEILIADIIGDEHFWPSLCFPLFQEILMSDKTYSEILNIMGKEIHKRSGKVDECLMDVLTKLFSPTEPYIDRWLQHVISYEDRKIRKDIDYNMPPTDCLMLSFKDFLIISITFLPPSFFPEEIQYKITEECRENLKENILHLNASCLIPFLIELYLYLMKKWSASCFKNELKCYSDIVSIVRKISVSYRDIEPRFAEALLTVVVLTLRGLKTVAIANPSLTKMFIESVGDIFNYEYEAFMVKYNNKQVDIAVGKYTEQKSFTLSFEALNELMLIQNSIPGDTYNQWFGQTKMLHKFIDCVGKFVSNIKTIALTKVAIECLITYAQSANSKDFLSSDIDVYLWEKLQTPSVLRNPKYIDYVHIESLPWELKEWWILYRRMIMLLMILLKKHGHMFLRQTLMFVSLYEDYFCDILLLERYTVESTALDLIKVALMFLHELFKYKSAWRLDHEQSLLSLLDAVKMSLNYSSAVLVRPSVLKYYTTCSISSTEELFTPDSLPSDLLVEVMNKLTDIITVGTYCIMEFSPPYYRLLRDDNDYSSWPLQVGSSFGLPTFGDNESCELTFGLLFCVSSVYVRILQQLASTKKSNQATSPREILIPRKSRISKSEDSKDKSMKLNDSNPSTQKSAEETTPDKESHFCFSQIKRLAQRPSVQSLTGFIKIDYMNPTYIVSAVENFSSYASPMKTFSWYTKLSEEKVLRALEAVVSLIAAQVSHILHPNSQVKYDSRLIKRELSSELQSFHEFVKRRFIETQRYVSSERSLFRKKFGIIEDELSKSIYDKNLAERVPNKRSLDMIKRDSTSKSAMTIEDKSAASSTSTNGLCEVKLITEDYLHLLSVWFSYFLHNE